MANSFTDLNQTIYSNYVLEEFIATLLPFSVFSTSFNADAVKRGAQVEVLHIPAQAEAQSFNGEYVMQNSNANGMLIPVDKHEYVSGCLTDTEWWENSQIELERFFREKGFQLAKKVWLDALSVVTAANYGSPGLQIAPDDFDSDTVIDLSKVCDDASWREFGRSLILNSALDTNLRKDPSIKDASAFGGSESIRHGRIPGLDKFAAIHGSTIFPSNGEGLLGFAVLPEAMAVAMRYLAPQKGHSYNEAYPLTDQATGLTIGFRSWYEPSTATSNYVFESVYGYKKLNGNAIKRIVAA